MAHYKSGAIEVIGSDRMPMPRLRVRSGTECLAGQLDDVMCLRYNVALMFVQLDCLFGCGRRKIGSSDFFHSARRCLPYDVIETRRRRLMLIWTICQTKFSELVLEEKAKVSCCFSIL